MSDFKREPRYIVFKLTDLQRYVSEELQDLVHAAGMSINSSRLHGGRPPFNAAVVEQDWPEFEIVWALIEARMTGKKFWEVVETQLADPTSTITFEQLRPFLNSPNIALIKAAVAGGKEV